MEDASGAGSRSESSARTTVNDCSRSKESLAAPMTGRKARDGHGNEEAAYARADRWEFGQSASPKASRSLASCSSLRFVRMSWA